MGTPRNGPSGKRPRGFLAGAGKAAVDDGVERRVAPVDPFDSCLDELLRACHSLPDEFGLCRRVLPGQLVFHATSSRRVQRVDGAASGSRTAHSRFDDGFKAGAFTADI